MTAVLVSAPALGDGLLALVLARNLEAMGRPATLYHGALVALRDWFPGVRIEPRPAADALRERMRAADCLFVGDPALVDGLDDEPAGGRRLVFAKACWDRSRPYLWSLRRAAERALDVAWTTDENGLVPPLGLAVDTAPGRVVLHPFSARAGKDWPPRRFAALAARFAGRGLHPVVLLGPGQAARWARDVPGGPRTATVAPLDAVAAWLRGAAGFVGVDSGIGHLASNLGVPTLSLFRKRSAARFWAPAWGRRAVVTPPVRLPGGQGHRYWGRLLTSRRVARAFERLTGGVRPFS